MRRSFVLPFLNKCIKIYFSNKSNKEIEYKKALFNTLKSLGGVYIKFLQVLCITQKFNDGWSTPKDFEIFDKVQIEPINITKVKKTLTNVYYIESNPFASGSFAQVYKGKLITGEEVAIKILRPSIVKNLKTDLIKLKRIVKIISMFMKNSLIDIVETFDEFSNSCFEETNYLREVANMEYFFKLYKNHKSVVIPKVYKEYCNKYIIVSEYIEGMTLANIIQNYDNKTTFEKYCKDQTGSDIWKQLTIAGGEALRTAMLEDYVYGDPHPGNIILLPKNKIAFVDFGIISNKPVSQEAFYLWTKSYYEILKGNKNYGEFLETTCMCFCPDLLNAFTKCTEDNTFMDSLINALNKKLEQVNSFNKVSNNYTEDGHLFKVFTEYIDNKNAIALKLDTRNFRLLKAMQAFICSLNDIDSKYGNNNFSNLMINCMEYALEYCEKHGIKKDFNRKTKYTINESYELLLNVITSLANNDEFLFNQLSKEMF